MTDDKRSVEARIERELRQVTGFTTIPDAEYAPLLADALALLREQKAEIERLQRGVCPACGQLQDEPVLDEVDLGVGVLRNLCHDPFHKAAP